MTTADVIEASECEELARTTGILRLLRELSQDCHPLVVPNELLCVLTVSSATPSSVCGDEANFRRRIEQLKATHRQGADVLIDLANKYLSDWRPSLPGYAP